MSKSLKSLDSKLIRGLCLAPLAMIAMTAQATRVTVDVRQADGSRAGSGIEVVVSENGVLTNNPPSATTDRQSRARFNNIAEGSVLITAFANGTQGTWRGQIRGKNQNVRLSLDPATDSSASPQDSGAGAVQTLAQPARPVVAMKINSDAACTATRQVYLNDTVTGTTPDQYRASENSSFSGSNWLDYQNDPAFTLSPAAGRKRVYYQVRGVVDGATIASEVVSDVIDLFVSNATVALSINNGADLTYNRTVTLNNTANFGAGGTNPRYIASERADFKSAEWQPYNSAPQFTLSEASGNKTVYFAVTRELCGTVVGAQASDSIGLAVATAVSVEAVGVAPAPAPDTTTQPVASTTPVVALRSFEFVNDGGRTVNALTPIEAIRYAEQQGFTHSERLIRGDGRCSRPGENGSREFADGQDQMWFRARPVVTKEPLSVHAEYLTCEFSLFGGRRLNRGWRVVSIAIDRVRYEPVYGLATIPKAPSGDDPSLTIQVILPGIDENVSTFTLCNIDILGDLLTLQEVQSACMSIPAFNLADFEQAAIITRLVIEGPTGDWHDAFRR